MKRIITLLFITTCTSAWAQTITINIQKALNPQQPVSNHNFENYLVQNLITYKIDTLKVKNGVLSLANKTTTITPFALARMQPRKAMIFYVEPKKDFSLTLVEPNFGITAEKGSKAQTDYMVFLRKQERLQQESQLVQQGISNVPNQDSLRQRMQYLQMEMNAQYERFVNEQRDNNLGAYLVFDVANKNQRIPPADLKRLYEKLSDAGKKTHFGKQIGNRIQRLSAMDMGNIAPDFTLKDANGKSHNLKKLRGKYVLIDFWASWCGPCVREIPHLKKAYEKYQSKGFEIMSVSIDRKRAQWLKAVDKYKMPWISVIDNPNNAEKITQKLYYVPTIPRTVLLDPSGKVIGKDFRGAALENQLEKLLN